MLISLRLGREDLLNCWVDGFGPAGTCAATDLGLELSVQSDYCEYRDQTGANAHLRPA